VVIWVRDPPGDFSRLSFGQSKDSHSATQQKDDSKKALQRKKKNWFRDPAE